MPIFIQITDRRTGRFEDVQFLGTEAEAARYVRKMTELRPDKVFAAVSRPVDAAPPLSTHFHRYARSGASHV